MSDINYLVRSADRVLKVLSLFKDNNSGYTLTEISNMAQISKATALRLLYTLKANNYVIYNEDNKRYTLGPILYMLGTTVFESLDIRKIAKPYLVEASNKTNFISHLGILYDAHVIIIEKIWPDNKKNFIKMVSEVGGIVPAYCTGVGKVLLADKDDEYIRDIMRDVEFKQFSDNTVKNFDELMEKIRKVREQGYGANYGEHEPYIKCITYPIFNVKGEVVAAMSLTGLIEEFNSVDCDYIHQVLKNTTISISRQLGYRL